jgi:Zn-finger protein
MTIPNSSRYFDNRNCKNYPCHKDIENINCLFCYCPCYPYVDCGGDYTLTKGIKDCSECLFPHIPENYDKVVDFLKRKLKPN